VRAFDLAVESLFENESKLQRLEMRGEVLQVVNTEEDEWKENMIKTTIFFDGVACWSS
jgi:hypothetical protein